MTQTDTTLRIIPAVLTPQKSDLSPDLDRFVRHCRWLLATGSDGLGILGTTGEANSFSVRERVAILEAAGAAGIPGERIIAGTGCCAIPDTVELSRKALEIGAAGVLVLPPFYYKNVKDDGIYGAIAETINRIGDARLKLYLYHFPQQSVVCFSLSLIERLIKAFPSVVVGIKDSSGDAANLDALLKSFPGFRIYPGSERNLYGNLKRGTAGTISATANVTATLAAEVVAAWRAGKDASAVEARLNSIRETIQAYPLVAALKAIMARHSGDKAWLNLRPPNTAITEAESRILFDKIDAAALKLAAAA